MKMTSPVKSLITSNLFLLQVMASPLYREGSTSHGTSTELVHHFDYLCPMASIRLGRDSYMECTTNVVC